PSPSAPSRKEAGTRALSKFTSQIWAPCWPIFFSGFPTETPGVSAGTMKAEIPPAPLRCGSLRAIRVNMPARFALVMNRLVPMTTSWSPSRIALVRTEAASEPAPGSVSAKLATTSPLASFGSHSAFCASLPNMTTPWLPIPTLVPITERKAGDVWPSSMATRTSSSIVRPRPPYSTGMERPNRPSARIWAITPSGTRSSSATLASIGMQLSRTKRRTVSSNWFRVSISSGIAVSLVSRRLAMQVRCGEGSGAEARHVDAEDQDVVDAFAILGQRKKDAFVINEARLGNFSPHPATDRERFGCDANVFIDPIQHATKFGRCSYHLADAQPFEG